MSFVHPNLMNELAKHHYPSLVTFQTMTTIYDASNEETITTYTDIDDLIDIQAFIDPVINLQETRQSNQTIVTKTYNIKLAGYYSDIDETLSVIDDVDRRFNITAVAHDDFQSQTMITCEIVNPNPSGDE